MRAFLVLTMMLAVSGCGLQLDTSGKKSNALNGETSDSKADNSPSSTTDDNSCANDEPVNEPGCDLQQGVPTTGMNSCKPGEIDENLCNLDLKEAIAACTKTGTDCSKLLRKLKLYESINYCELREPEPPPQESDCDLLNRLIAECEKAGNDCTELYRKRKLYEENNYCALPENTPPQESECDLLNRLIGECEKAGNDCTELYRKRETYASNNDCKSPPPDNGPN